jgi:hypothetical protein
MEYWNNGLLDCCKFRNPGCFNTIFFHSSPPLQRKIRISKYEILNNIKILNTNYQNSKM